MKKSLLCILLSACLLSACSVTKQPVAMGGSKADGIVTMGFVVRRLESPVIDWSTANNSALQRCRVWGYSHAEAFGGQTSECSLFSSSGVCTQRTVTIPYQCS